MPNPNHNMLARPAQVRENQLPIPSFCTWGNFNSKLHSSFSSSGLDRKHSSRWMVSGRSYTDRQTCWLQAWLLWPSRSCICRNIYSHIFMGNTFRILQRWWNRPVSLWNHSLQDGYFFPQSPTGLSAFLPFSELLGCSSGEEPAELQPGFKVQTKHDLGSGTMMFSLLGRKGRENNPDIWFPILGLGVFLDLYCVVFSWYHPPEPHCALSKEWWSEHRLSFCVSNQDWLSPCRQTYLSGSALLFLKCLYFFPTVCSQW